MGETVARDALAGAKRSIQARPGGRVGNVSCTGHMMPSLDAHLINHLGLPPTVREDSDHPARLLCWCRSRRAGVDAARAGWQSAALVVTVELSTLGMQVSEPSMTDMVANLLFGDGAAAVVLAA